MQVETIEDLGDPRVAVYRGVRDSALRDSQGLFVVESRLCVERLLQTVRHRVHSMLLTQTAFDALRAPLQSHRGEFPIYLASPEVLRAVVGFNLHRGCIAAAWRGDQLGLDGVLEQRPQLLVGLEGVANPENVGNVFRNARAFGADAVVLSEDCADPLYRKAIRVSMAASLHTPFARVPAWPAAMDRLREARFQCCALSPTAGAEGLAELDAADVRVPLLLLFGAEGEGLRAGSIAAADRVLRIPIADGVDSLNVATASGVALHHVFERRAQSLLAATDGDTSTAE